MDSDTQPGEIRFVSRSGERVFAPPARVVAAYALDKVWPCLWQVEAAIASGHYAVGFVSYEAAPAFNDALTTHPPGDVPLVWFGICDPPAETAPAALGSCEAVDAASPNTGPWRALVDEDVYLDTVEEIRELIAAGDTYQVNYTFPMAASFEGDARAWFERLCRNQQSDHAAFIDTGRFKILSVSPELFFKLDGETLTTRPMKGTHRRGRWPEEDRRAAAELAASEKDRAENVMIVDLLRNDMGRVSETGSVHVPRLFDVERYETVWQMTSTIESCTTATVPEILTALFPSGSVTGAPKVRTMQIIQEMESHPRGVYCGAIGWWGPDRQAELNVAIRTVTVDTERNVARYHVGGGITWGSEAEAEYAECCAKAEVLSADRPEFELLESLFFDGEFFLLDKHMERLAASAEYFGFEVDVEAVRASLRERTERTKGTERTGEREGDGRKVRLLVARDGSHRIEVGNRDCTKRGESPSRDGTVPISGAPATSQKGGTEEMGTVPSRLGDSPRLVQSPFLRLGFAAEPVDSNDVFLFHKTTHRGVYERALASRPDCDDVLLWNERGEITESAYANVALELDGECLTPPLHSGLLAGTMRGHLLERGEIREAVLMKGDVTRASRIALINSVSKRTWPPPEGRQVEFVA